MLADVRLNNRDPHLLFSTVGMRLGLIPEEIIMRAFMAVWVQAYKEVCSSILNKIKQFIPHEKEKEALAGTLFP